MHTPRFHPERIAALVCLLPSLLSIAVAAQDYLSGQKYAAAEARQAAKVARVDARGPFHANWNSLGHYQAPGSFSQKSLVPVMGRSLSASAAWL